MLEFYPAVQTEQNFVLTFDSEGYFTKEGIQVIHFLDFIRQMPELFRP